MPPFDKAARFGEFHRPISSVPSPETGFATVPFRVRLIDLTIFDGHAAIPIWSLLDDQAPSQLEKSQSRRATGQRQGPPPQALEGQNLVVFLRRPLRRHRFRRSWEAIN